MSDLDNAINSINASAAKAENTATFLDDMSTFDDQSSVTNPNNGQTVASIPKQVKDRTDELFTAAESDINQAVSDAEQSAIDAQDAADSIGRYQGLWPDTGGIADKGDTYQTQVSGTPTGKYFTALQNTTADPVSDDVNWRAVLTDDFGNVINGTQVQLRRGDNAEILAGTPALGELWFNITDNSIHMGDGITPGGIKHVNIKDGVASFDGANIKMNGYYFEVYENAAGREFIRLVNSDTGLAVMTLADGSAADAATFADSLQCRKDGHTLLSTAGTVGGATDVDFRTSGGSDYAYIQAVSTYQNTNLLALIDRKPARADGTKKDGTGGGGQLDPSDDIYQFDATIQMRSNVNPDISDHETCLRFPVAPIIAEQGYGVRRRGSGANTYWTTYDGNDNAKLECVESGLTLENMTPSALMRSNTVFPSSGMDFSAIPICSEQVYPSSQIRRFSFCDTKTNITTSDPYIIKLVDSSLDKRCDIKLNIYTSGGSLFYYDAKGFISNGSVGIKGAIDEDLPNQIGVTLSSDAEGDMSLSVAYTGGLGVNIRVIASYEVY